MSSGRPSGRRRCAVLGCKTGGIKNYKIHHKITMHELPKREERKKQWLDILGIENLNTKTKRVFICSLHFKEECFNQNNLYITRLWDDALPSRELLMEVEPPPDNSKEGFQEKDGKAYPVCSSLSLGGDTLNFADSTNEEVITVELEPLPDNSKEGLQEKDGTAYQTVCSSFILTGDTLNLADCTQEVEIKEEPLPNICNDVDPLHLPQIEDVAVKEEEEPLPDICSYDDLLDLPDENGHVKKDKPRPDISNEWPRGKVRVVPSSMDIGESIDTPTNDNKLATYVIYKGKTSNNAKDANADNDDNKTPKSCACDFNKAVIEAKYEARIMTLEKQLEKQRTTSKERHKKIKTLRRAMSRLVEKNKKLFDLLVERTLQNEGSEYLANSDNLNGNSGKIDESKDNLNESDINMNESDDENE